MLMSNSEALHSLYGEISTERDGDLTHQCIQTNLADVICGGECTSSIESINVICNRSINFQQAIPMTRSSIQGRRSDAVHRFRRRAAWNAGTVCGSLARRSACNAAPPREVCPRPTPKRSIPRTAAVRNTKAQIRHHPVSIYL